jgi:hypothetical protein
LNYRILAIVAVATVAATAARQVVPGPATGTFIGPSSSQPPYVVPTSEGWTVTSLITAGDAVGVSHYVMAGLPDGLGALAGRAGSGGAFEAAADFITVLLNHEMPADAGGARAHGQTGAFVSEWVIELDSLRVVAGADLIREVYLWNGSTHVLSSGPATAFSRFCSATLADRSAFSSPWGLRGTTDRLFLNGEEVAEGRAFAHVVSGSRRGESYQLPFLGRIAFENVVASPNAGAATVVVALDDSSPGQVYVYIGDKRRDGTLLQRAGLEDGRLYGIKVTDGGTGYGNGPVPFESNGAINGRFTLESVTDVATGSGAGLQATSRARGITEFARPEDGHWDTRNSRVFYFATTGAAVATPPGAPQSQSARLYKLTFDTWPRPTGGRIEVVVDSASLTGRDGQPARSFDNLVVDGSGRIVVQEDPGASSYLAKIWRINPARPSEAEQIAHADPARFLSGSQFLTQQEEHSGVIEITSFVKGARWYQLGRRYYLADTMAHYPLASPMVEGGQLYLISSRLLAGR